MKLWSNRALDLAPKPGPSNSSIHAKLLSFLSAAAEMARLD
ncbi:hypothetical protein BofuT4_P104220.1 [Botrytis cinerea T4]|uniref:Uncharacterized protein n=1 Tax=Botryotinia fuckeliana (strain T4) TaxID=999810 RepID=G2YAG5_BOTF4|nr:hypothetical protein BofuT4_P104220.1 [Botrytis cinerea T4]